MTTAPLTQYTRVANDAARRVITGYSTSFGLATRLLAPQMRAPIRSIYALVRVADEIVDGVATAAGLDVDAQRERLCALEVETDRAVSTGFSTDLIVHSFAVAARRFEISRELTEPFFRSMEMDLVPGPLDLEEQRRYVHGSAEVIGLMCLKVFLVAQPPLSPAEVARAEQGACALGAAFQNVNFLRDLRDDTLRGRMYLPTSDGRALDEAAKQEWVERVFADIRVARSTLPLLPPSARRAVAAALGMFEELGVRIAATTLDALLRGRVSVPTATKVRIIARAATRNLA